MVVLEDFTRTSGIHNSPGEGFVEHCRRCGRSGFEQHFPHGEPIVVHSQISEVLGDGMRVEPQDCCAIPRT
jgi:hypothetical protein